MNTDLRIFVNVNAKAAMAELRAVQTQLTRIGKAKIGSAATAKANTGQKAANAAHAVEVQKRYTVTKAMLDGITAAEKSAAEVTKILDSTSARIREANISKRYAATKAAIAAEVALEKGAAAQKLALQKKEAGAHEAFLAKINASLMKYQLKEGQLRHKAMLEFVANSKVMIAQSEKESAARIAGSKAAVAAQSKDMLKLKAVQESIRNTNARPGGALSPIPNLGLAAKAIGGFGTGLDKAGSKMINFGRQSQWLGRQIEFRLSFPIIIATALATKLFLDTDAAFTRLRKVYNKTGASAAADLEAIAITTRKLSDAFGINQADVAEMGAAWAQAGAVGDQLQEVMAQTVRAATLTNSDMASTQEQLLTIMKAYRLEVEDLNDVINLFNRLENDTSANFADLAQIVKVAGATAQAAGVEIGELAAAGAALVPAFGSANEVGNAFKTLIPRVMAPTAQAARAFKDLGININTTTWQSKNWIERLIEIGDAQSGLADNQRLVNSVAVAQLRQLTKFLGVTREVSDRQGEFATTTGYANEALKNEAVALAELSAQIASPSQQMKTFGVQMKNLAIDIITPLIPLILSMAWSLRDAVIWFTNLNPAVQKVIGYVLLFVAVLGPLQGTLGSVFILLGILTRGFVVFFLGIEGQASVLSRLTGVLATVGTAFWGVAVAAWGAMTSMLTAVYTAAAALPATITAGFASSPALTVAAIVAAVVVILLAISMVIYQWGPEIWKAMVWVWEGLVTVISASGSAIWSAIGYVFAGAVSLAVQIFWLLPQGVRDAVVEVARAIAALPGVFSQALGNLLRVISGYVQAIFAWLQLLNPFHRQSPSLVDNVRSGVSTIVNEYARLKGLKGSLTPMIKEFQDFAQVVEFMRRSQGRTEARVQRRAVAEIAPGTLTMYDQARTKIIALGKAQAQVGAQIAGVEANIEGLRGGLEQAENAVEGARAALKGLQDQAAGMERGIRDARDEMGRMQDEAKGIEKALDGAREVMAALEDQAGNLGQKISDATSEIGRLSGMNIAGEANFDEKLFNMNHELDKLNLQKLNLEIASGGSLDNDHPLNKMIAAQEQLIRQQQLIRDIEFDPLKRQIEQQVNPVEEMDFGSIMSGIQAQQSIRAGLETELASIDASMVAQQGVIDALEGDLAVVNGVIEAQGELIAGMERNLRDVNDAIGVQSDEVERLQGAVGVWNERIAEQEAIVGDLRSEYDRIGESIQKAEQDMSDFISTINELKDARDAAAAAAEAEAASKASGGGAGADRGTLPVAGDLGLTPGNSDLFSATGDMENTNFDDIIAGVQNQQAGLIDAFDIGEEIQKVMDDAFGGIEMPEFATPGSMASDAFSGMWDGLKSATSATGKWLWGWLQWLGGLFVSAWGGIKTGLSAAWGGIKTATTTSFGAIGTAISWAWEGVKTATGAAWDWVTSKIGIAVDWVSAKWGQFMGWLQGTAFWENITGGIDRIKEAWFEMVAKFDVAWEELKLMWDAASTWISGAWEVIWGPLKGWLEDEWKKIQIILAVAWELIKVAWEAAWAVFEKAWEDTWGVLSVLFEVIWAGFKGTLEAAFHLLVGIWEVVWILFKGAWEIAWNVLTTLFDAAWSIIVTAIEVGFLIIGSTFDIIWGIFTGNWTQVWEGLKGLFEAAWKVVALAIDLAWEALKLAFEVLWTSLETTWNATWAAIQVIAEAIWDTLKIPFDAVKAGIVKIFESISDPVKTAINRVVNPVRNAINSMIGIINTGLRAIDGIAKFFGGSMDFRLNYIPVPGRQPNDPRPLAEGTANIRGFGNVRTSQVGSGFETSMPRAIVGEGLNRHSEFVIPTDPQYRSRALDLFSALGNKLGASVPAFAAGGFDPGMNRSTIEKSSGGGFWDRLKDIIAKINPLNLLDKARTFIADRVNALSDNFGSVSGFGDFSATLTKMAKSQFQRISNWVFNLLSFASPSNLLGMLNNFGIPLAHGGIVAASRGGTHVIAGEGGRDEAVIPLPPGFDIRDLSNRGGNGPVTNVFHGDLSFPNVTNEKDAEEFLRTLESLSR